MDLNALLFAFETHPSFLEAQAPALAGDPTVTARAEAALGGLEDRSPTSDDLGRLAILLLAGANPGPAAAAAVAALELSPDDAGSLHLAGTAAFVSKWVDAAERFYRRALAVDPLRSMTWRALASALYIKTRYRDALEAYRRAVAVAPDAAEPWRNLARTALLLKRGEEAAAGYRRCIRLAPTNAEAYRNMGNVELGRSDYGAAARWFRRSYAMEPSSDATNRSLADACFLTGNSGQATRYQERALRLRGAGGASVVPLDGAIAQVERWGDEERRSAPACRSLLERVWAGGHRSARLAMILGTTAAVEGRLDEARRHLDLAIALEPASVMLACYRAMVLLACGMEDAATDALVVARRDDPATVDAWLCGLLGRWIAPDSGLGVVEIAWNRWLAGVVVSKAAALRRVMVRAMAEGPETASLHWLHGHLGVLSGDTADLDRGVAHWLAASGATDPFELFKLMWITARTLQESGDLDAARRVCDAYLAEPPLLTYAYGALFTMIGYFPGQLDLWLERVFAHTDRLIAFLRTAPDTIERLQHAVLSASFLADDDRHYDALCRFAVDFYRQRACGGEPVEAPLPVSTAPAPADRRIRVGYVVTDFLHQDLPPEQHVLRYHDRSRFDVHVYFFTPGTLPHARRLSGVPPLLVGFDGVVRNLTGLPAAEAASIIRADGIDILVDVVGWWPTEVPELFVLRPAPVQVTWLGLGRPGKAGIIDYIVGTETLFPRVFDERYPETFIRFPGSYIPPKPQLDPITRTPRHLLGIPEDAFVFLGYHQSMKVTRACLELWMTIMRRTSNSVLMVGEQLRDGIAPLAERFGVSPERILLMKWVRTEAENIARIGAADLYLDSFPFNSAGLTGFDAIRMNVPRITMVGNSLYSRFGQILLGALGLDELVCRSPQEYVDLAVSLCQDRSRLDAIRGRMAEAAVENPLIEAEPLMRKLEWAYARIWDRHTRGEPPAAFDVPARPGPPVFPSDPIPGTRPC